MKYFFRSISITLICLCLFFVYLAYIKQSEAFLYTHIHCNHPYNPRWDFGPPSAIQQNLLDEVSRQPFTLLGHGKKCYAFVSLDGNIVIKMFKQKRVSNTHFLYHPPIPKVLQSFRREVIKTHDFKRHGLYQSYQIAYERLSNETGVLYLHLTQTKGLNRTIQIKTPKGKNIILPLDTIEFAIQKRGFSIVDIMQQYPEKRKMIVSSMVDLIVEIGHKRIGNRMINYEEDLGFAEGKVIQINGGQFYPSIQKPLNKEELENKTLPIKSLLEKIDPKLVDYLEEKIQQVLV